MIEAIGKYVGGRVLTALIVVASAMALIWYLNLPQATKDAIWGLVQGALVWLGFAAILPWALFFVPALVLKTESNTLSAVVLLLYLAVDIGFAMYLTGGTLGTTLQAGVMIVGFLAAGVYNFIICESLARRADDAT